MSYLWIRIAAFTAARIGDSTVVDSARSGATHTGAGRAQLEAPRRDSTNTHPMLTSIRMSQHIKHVDGVPLKVKRLRTCFHSNSKRLTTFRGKEIATHCGCAGPTDEQR